jgi:homoserine dehydrogenase
MIDVPVALLGYGTVGSAVDRLLAENAEDIERATGHRLRVVRALVRDPSKERPEPPVDGVLTTDFAAIRDDPSVALVAEVMGGVEPTGDYVLELLRAGKPVVSANKQLIARRGAELFHAASEAGVQLRFEASVCAAIPVIKILREALVATTVHRVLGIVNGTTNYILTKMEEGAEYADALADAQRLGYAEADPTEDVNGADAAAKMAILSTIAFGSRTTLADVAFDGIEQVTSEHVRAAREMEMVVRLIGAATLTDGKIDVRVGPALVDRHHPLAAVEGAMNAVMLQGDAIREITLEGPGAGGMETASAVVADMVLRIEVEDVAGVLAQIALRLSAHRISVARLVQHQRNGSATLHVVTHEGAEGDLKSALQEIESLPETRGAPSALPVISDRGIAGLGWA